MLDRGERETCVDVDRRPKSVDETSPCTKAVFFVYEDIKGKKMC